ncbi:unnamed protein product, partial [Prorocentrum cordatum]
ATLWEAGAKLLRESDAMTSVTSFRRQLAVRVGLQEHGSDDRAAEVLDLIRRAWRPAPTAATPEEKMKEIVTEVGPEVAGKRHQVYLITLSRALPETADRSNLVDASALAREAVGEAVRKAFDEPLGRAPDGLAPPKKALRERDGMATHWSCSHTQWWSTLRYGAIPTLHKTTVDDDPWTWTKVGVDIDFFGESQGPWNAHIWKRQRKEAEKAATAGTAKRARRFTKLGLTALILDRNLQTKAALLEYAQDYGTDEMQRYVHAQQKRLKEHLAEAAEWGAARATARAERKTDWELVCRTADGPCPHGTECQYSKSTSVFFEKNRATLSQSELAAALRAIILNGPSKTTRTPMTVGPTNTGKSTVLLPFDDLFGFKHVFHKPAVGSPFALRNIVKDKKFLFWDDYQPIEFAEKAVPVQSFLSLFEGHPFEPQAGDGGFRRAACARREIEGAFGEGVSSAGRRGPGVPVLTDGNIDFKWRRGAAMTAKEDELWKPAKWATEEDIGHMKNRVLVFIARARIPRITDTHKCARCVCRWIRDAASAADCDVGLRDASSALLVDLLAMGAVDVRELGGREWQSLAAWARLKPLGRRRLEWVLQGGA